MGLCCTKYTCMSGEHQTRAQESITIRVNTPYKPTMSAGNNTYTILTGHNQLHTAWLVISTCLQWPYLIKTCGKSVYLHIRVSFFCKKSLGEDKTIDTRYLSTFQSTGDKRFKKIDAFCWWLSKPYQACPPPVMVRNVLAPGEGHATCSFLSASQQIHEALEALSGGYHNTTQIDSYHEALEALFGGYHNTAQIDFYRETLEALSGDTSILHIQTPTVKHQRFCVGDTTILHRQTPTMKHQMLCLGDTTILHRLLP